MSAHLAAGADTVSLDKIDFCLLIVNGHLCLQ
jgi:hypothetical protein